MSERELPTRREDAFLAWEAERTLLDYSWAWEGERETTEQLDGAVLRRLAVKWSGLDGMIAHVSCDPNRADAQLDAILKTVREQKLKVWIVVGESARPRDVA